MVRLDRAMLGVQLVQVKMMQLLVVAAALVAQVITLVVLAS
jgi:hypothetical protein